MPIEPRPYWVNMWPTWDVKAPLCFRTQHASREAAKRQRSIAGKHGPPAYRIKVTPLTPAQREARRLMKAWRKAHPAVAQVWATTEAAS